MMIMVPMMIDHVMIVMMMIMMMLAEHRRTRSVNSKSLRSCCLAVARPHPRSMQQRE
jgi:hypothetical protein